MKIVKQKVKVKDKIPESIIVHKMALDLVHSLSDKEFRQVFQWQKDIKDVDSEWVIYQMAFLGFRFDFNTPIIERKQKKLNKLQRFVKFIFKL